MVSTLLVVGILVAVFVGFNIGGSSTGVAFGPAVGSNTMGKLSAAVLMTTFALLGGWTVGREVIKTMGGEIVPQTEFTLAVSVAILFFVGMALLVSNLFGVPASTSMTAVGAIAGLGVATGTIRWEVMGRIVTWWLVAPILAFWVCAVIGRYLYPYLEAWFALDRTEGDMFDFDRSGAVPIPRLADSTTYREVIGATLVVAIGCYMAFSAGASNVANAIAPLYANEALAMTEGILLASGAIGLGAFTIARRTLDTVGNDLTELPILAALIVEVVSASLITFLSANGIPASLAVSATMCVVGLGWGRATRTTRLSDAAGAAVSGEGDPDLSVDALAKDGGDDTKEPAEPGDVARIGEEDPDQISAVDLFDPAATGRVVVLWILTPSISAVASYAVFQFTTLAV
ncbi:inorganic phosphate transporter [Haloarculaceae archaeon H-GB11]|nr:inorganic phosphate transporter [Haloarculaceae archaeon H-GB1-1]MEA5385718.1 inorganic phosphate transporter [Haloarculaceae archaeon H-GB11]